MHLDGDAIAESSGTTFGGFDFTLSCRFAPSPRFAPRPRRSIGWSALPMTWEQPATRQMPRPPVTHTDSHQLFRDYVAWRGPDAARSSDAERFELVGQIMLDFQTWYRAGLPWDPDMLRAFLLDYLPVKIVLEEHEVASTPTAAAELLRFLGENAHLPIAEARALAGLAESLGDEFERAVREASGLGPARGLVFAMEVEGVDPTDVSDVDRWLRDFSRRPLRRRAAALPDVLGTSRCRGRSRRRAA